MSLSQESSRPIQIPHMTVPHSEVHAVGSLRMVHGETAIPGGTTDSRVFTDGRRLNGEIGFQTSYLSLFPPGTPVDIFWSGQAVPRGQALYALENRITHVANGTPSMVLLTGGEHLHPETFGVDRPPDPDQKARYGEPDHARDRAGLALLDHAEATGARIGLVCRGSQLGIKKYSGGLASLGDHGQEEHHVERHKDGAILRYHGVEDVFPEDIRESLGIELPEVKVVNSAHAQGFRRRDIGDEAMAELNRNGWYPWLVATVPDVDYLDQTYEGWLRVQNGKITGIMTQFHPELQMDEHGDHGEYGENVRRFFREVVFAGN